MGFSDASDKGRVMTTVALVSIIQYNKIELKYRFTTIYDNFLNKKQQADAKNSHQMTAEIWVKTQKALPIFHEAEA